MKKNKTIIELGHRKTKVLGVKYGKGHINITGTYIFDSSKYFQNDDITDIKGLVNEIYDLTYTKQYVEKADILLSLPAGMFQYRILKLENVREKDINKRMAVEESTWINVNTTSHVLGWSLLGKRNINNEIVYYVMQTAINKNVANAFSKEFENKGMKLTGITTVFDSIINLTYVYMNDFEHMTKLFIDMGMNKTSFILVNQDVVIDIREIDFGYARFMSDILKNCHIGTDTIRKLLNKDISLDTIEEPDREKYNKIYSERIMYFNEELKRTYDNCEIENLTITKIIVLGDYIEGIFDNVEDVEIQQSIFETGIQYDCESFDIEFDDTAYVSPQLAAAVGTAIHTMLPMKDNLLTVEYNDKYLNGYIKKGFIIICILISFGAFAALGNMLLSNFNLSMLMKKSTEYAQKQNQISELEQSIEENTKKLEEYQSDFFPFYDFMYKLNAIKPDSVTIISLDSPDRLKNVEDETKSETDNTEENTENGTQVIGEAGLESPSPTPEPTPTAEPMKYTADLKGTNVILRGKGFNEESVVKFIYDISNIDCVNDLQLNAIEERVEDDVKIKIFEVVINLK